MTTLLAIDPGSSVSAWVCYTEDSGTVVDHGIDDNITLLGDLRRGRWGRDTVVIEWTAPRGMPASEQLFETLWWAGRFSEAIHPSVAHRVQRSAVKRHLCGTSAARDSNVIAALIDRFGGSGGKAAAVGLKASPGPLYGVKRDVWQALGLAITYAEIGGIA